VRTATDSFPHEATAEAGKAPESLDRRDVGAVVSARQTIM
jgi:hypothetical protein